MAIVSGINRLLVPWSEWVGVSNPNASGAWLTNGLTNEEFDLPTSIDEPSSFKKRFDDTMGMMSENAIGYYYGLELPNGAGGADATINNGPRKFSMLRGADLQGQVTDPGYCKMQEDGEVAIKGDEL